MKGYIIYFGLQHNMTTWKSANITNGHEFESYPPISVEYLSLKTKMRKICVTSTLLIRRALIILCCQRLNGTIEYVISFKTITIT